MLFSCLVDADYRDTDAFLRPGRGADLYAGLVAGARELEPRLSGHLADVAAGAPDTPVNRLRARVLAACEAAAERPAGRVHSNRCRTI
jgi:CRISPR-associated endonuclease/helicase Cas3